MGLTRLPGNADGLWRQIDIRICPVPSMPYMLLGNTGDDTLMKILRQAAKDK
jgi:DNA polymerase beta